MNGFTTEEYANAKQQHLLMLLCDVCGNPFYRTKKRIYLSTRSKTKRIVCSKVCSLRLTPNKPLNLCMSCGKETKHKFCNHSCSAKYSNEHREYDPKTDRRNKVLKCKVCNKDIIVNIRASKETKCETCRESSKSTKTCSVCGTLKCKNKFCRFVRNHIDWFVTIWGISKKSIGTLQVFEEMEKLKCVLYDEYINQELSLKDIANKHGNAWYTSIKNLLSFFDIPRREIGASIRLAIKQGKGKTRNINAKKNQYKQGWHTTWDNKLVFLRSSYEFRYAKELDDKKIIYEVESKRIPYIAYDGFSRTYIPDFFIPNDNKIVEIKSTYTIDKNTKIKLDKCRQLGYTVEMIVYDKSQD